MKDKTVLNNIVGIRVCTLDGDLLNDIFRYLLKKYPYLDNYIVNRELHQMDTIFTIGNRINSISINSDILEKMCNDMVDYLDINIDGWLPSVYIKGNMDSRIYKVTTVNGKLGVKCVKNVNFKEVDPIEQAIYRMSKMLKHEAVFNDVAISTLASDNVIVSISIDHEKRIDGYITKDLKSLIYMFLSKKQSHALTAELVGKYIEYRNQIRLRKLDEIEHGLLTIVVTNDNGSNYSKELYKYIII